MAARRNSCSFISTLFDVLRQVICDKIANSISFFPPFYHPRSFFFVCYCCCCKKKVSFSFFFCLKRQSKAQLHRFQRVSFFHSGRKCGNLVYKSDFLALSCFYDFMRPNISTNIFNQRWFYNLLLLTRWNLTSRKSRVGVK